MLGLALTWLLGACAASGNLAPADAGMTRQQAQLEGLEVVLESPREPQTFQPQRLLVSLRDDQGRPLEGAGVELDLAMPMLCASGGKPQAREVSLGNYRAEASFEMSGAWNVTVAVTHNGERQTATFLMQVAEDPATVMRNPFAGDLTAVTTGQQIYAGNCASCHGDTGRGDGPLAPTLQVPPADLSVHLVPDKHSDGEIFRWIRDGVAGSAMPAFGAVISEENRWRLVSYLRTLPAAAPAEAATPLPPLAFAQAGNLYLGDGISPEPKQVPGTSGLGGFQGPVFAPDGGRLAVIVNQSTAVTETGRFTVPTLYLLRPDGSELQPLWYAPDQELFDPAWTADGSAVVVTAHSFTVTGSGGGLLGEPELVRVDVATGQRTPLVARGQGATFSRDGAKLAFIHSDAGGAGVLALADVDGGNQRTILADRGFRELATPRFAPDGEVIIFSAAGGPPVDAEGRPVAGEPPTLLTAALALLAPPTAEAHSGDWEVWSVRLDGSELRRLTRLATHYPTAAFSPDGAQLVVASEEGIFLMQRDGSEPRRLSPAMVMGGIDWAPRP